MKLNKVSLIVFAVTFLMSVNLLSAQAVTDVKLLVQENEYGNARLKVTPLSTDMTAKKPTKTSGVYGLLVCYKYKGEQKALHQDLTYDFHKKGYREVFLGMQAKISNIVIGESVFYRRDLTPENKRPKKADCFN